MILQALVRHYEDLAQKGTQNLPQMGWSRVMLRFELHIDWDGKLKALIPIVNENGTGRPEMVPEQMKRSGTVPKPYYLCDGAPYVLGIEKEGITEKSKKYFSAFVSENISRLSACACDEAAAIIRFLQSWDPDKEIYSPLIQEAIANGLDRGSITFRVGNSPMLAIHMPAIRDGWNAYYQSTLLDEHRGTCLVTGRDEAIARIHNSVKGIYAKSLAPNGWTLVGFDKGSPAYNSFGKEQGYNAPVGKYAAFAYTAALNHLLADREHVYRIGDTTVVCWAEGGEPAYQGMFGGYCFGQKTVYSEGELQNMVEKMLSRSGEPVTFDETRLDPDRPFYILGLAPNAARLSVRFFLRNSFGNFLKNVQRHYDRLNIVKPAYEKFEVLPPWRLLSETVNQNSKDKSPTPGMAGEVMRAILNNIPYPATLLNGVALRIRAEREVTWGRAAILKAYYTKNPHPDVPKEEVLTVSLNEESTNIPYTLGRLFSVLEAIQSAANPNINTTIKDKYFNSASATPSRVFPTLINLAQKHLRKLEGGRKIYFEKQLTALAAILDDTYPDHLSLPQQGSFQLGYYHQTQKRYEKKEEA